MVFLFGFGCFALVRTGWQSIQPGAEDRSADKQDSGPSTNERFPTVIRRPPGPPRTAIGVSPDSGEPVTVACSTCHKTRLPQKQTNAAEQLDEFHTGLSMAHGKLTCLSCHNENDYDTLKLADGRTVQFADVMTLCGQCHGPQLRDYQHGAHGGMNGYGDTRRGPRERNNCIDCHHPHEPAFPRMKPGFKPRDRFLETGSHPHE